MLEIKWMEKSQIQQAQSLVTKEHYLHKPIDTRCSIQGYDIQLNGQHAGVLLFGRPEATRCYPWYGSVAQKEASEVEVTRWQIINLARVFVKADFQPDGLSYRDTPGFIDRQGKWRSTLLSTAIKKALDQIVVDYLIARPPCFLDEPYSLGYCLSYCDTRFHTGSLYRVAGFELYRQNKQGIQTWRKLLRPLTIVENEQVQAASLTNERSQKYRENRLVLSS